MLKSLRPIPAFSSPGKLSRESFLGLDIGGANLKCADLSGRTASTFFPLWRRPGDLAAALVELRGRFPRAQHIAVTMTGELADCFEDAADGVRHIVEHTTRAFAAPSSLARTASFYSLDGCFVSANRARRHPDPLAASNWHALANLVASMTNRPSLLIDIGSTTTDLSSLAAGKLQTDSRTDFDRLQTTELIYVGIERTPLCALVEDLPVDGKRVPVMKEVFATTDDCALLTGITGESPLDCQTADGRPRTVVAARGRLARMVGLDHRRFSEQQARRAAEACLQALTARILAAAHSVAPTAEQWILGGHGAPLMERWGRQDAAPPQHSLLPCAAKREREGTVVMDFPPQAKLPADLRRLPDLLLPLCHRGPADDRHSSDCVSEPHPPYGTPGDRQPTPVSEEAIAISRVAPAFAVAYLLAKQTCTALSR